MKVRNVFSKPVTTVLVASAIALSIVAGAGLAPVTAAHAVTVGEASGVDTLGITPQQVVEAKIGTLSGSSAVIRVATLKKSSPKTVTLSSRSAKSSKTAAYKAVQAAKIAASARAIVPLTGWKTAKVSWYGPGFYGHTMAGGGQLTPTSMVVAHRSMKFGTKIQFTYRGKTVVAVVKDRGPYVSGRTFDLGPGTAKALGFSGVGTVSWRIVK
ncbi:MAG: septal ring lytic transglycosylase RlpA family protein [Coriobacteriia bacterium]